MGITYDPDKIPGITDNEDQQTVDRANTAASDGTIVVTSTAAIINVGVSNLTNRKTILIQPRNGNVFVGFSSGGGQPFRVARNSFFEAKIGPDLDLWVRTNSGTVNLAVVEFA